MKKHFLTSILMLASIIIGASTLVDAQSNHRFAIDIPFDFIVVGRTLPAGRYTVERLDPATPNVLMIKNKDNRMTRVFLTQRVGGEHQRSRTSTLVFKQHGPAYHLVQVWMYDDMNGNRLTPTDENERHDQRSNNSVVRVRANNKGP